MGFFDGIKSTLINTGMKLISIDEKIVRMFLETSSSNVRQIVILPASKIPMKTVVKTLENKSKHGYVYNGRLNGVEVSVIQTRMGAPRTAMIMECLKRCNVKIAIRIDFCGGLVETGAPELQTTGLGVGDLIVPESVFLTDGTCMQYLQKYAEVLDGLPGITPHDLPTYKSAKIDYCSVNGKYWSADVDRNLFAIFKPDKRVLGDILWSTDALFCEEKDFFDIWRIYDCNSVDMESAAVYLLGRLFGIRIVSVLSISDLPDSEKYCMQTSNNFHPGLMKGLKNAFNLLLQRLPEVQKEV